MASNTPEGKVKAEIDKLLDKAPFCSYDKPVVGPFGNAMLDYVGCSRGRYFEIEAKAPGKKPTERQVDRGERKTAAGATVFFIDGAQAQLDSLRDWLHAE